MDGMRTLLPGLREAPWTDDCLTSGGSLYWGVFLTAAASPGGPARGRAR